MSRHREPTVVRARLHHLLDDEVATIGLPVVVRWSLIVLIVCNLAASVMESVPWLHDRYEAICAMFEMLSLGIFALEYAARIWAAPERRDLAVEGRGARLAFITSVLTDDSSV